VSKELTERAPIWIEKLRAIGEITDGYCGHDVEIDQETADLLEKINNVLQATCNECKLFGKGKLHSGDSLCYHDDMKTNKDYPVCVNCKLATNDCSGACYD
jgi:hypothetical protein